MNLHALALGPVVWPSTMSPATLARAIDPALLPLVLAPSDGRGWFGGTPLVCWSPVRVLDDLTPQQAALELDAVMRGAESVLAAALLPYEGPAEVRIYRGGLIRNDSGWRGWGELPAVLPQVGEEVAPELGPLLADACADLDQSGYMAGVRATQQRITAGDVYVLNLTYRVCGAPTVPVTDAFAALLERAASPMAALWGHPERALASVSPERFCRLEREGDDLFAASIEPIKGTRPRHPDPVEDARLARELRADDKERAEHVMIVDMERNDLGGVALPGSVVVDPLLEVFGTPYCHQLVSSVRGLLRPEASLAELVSSAFPCGSVTGAPKRAAMRIIGELERSPRGAYTGSLLVAVPGAVDSSVLIRTLEYQSAMRACWGTGCGITIDSSAQAEWAESLLKLTPTRACP